MRNRHLIVVLLALVAGTCAAPATTRHQIVVPRLWTDAALQDWATPVAGLGMPPTFVSEAVYYAAPEDNLRTYPVYHPDREPEGYRESLLANGPQPLIEPERLRTEQDWIAAGERVFEQLDSAIARTDDPAVIAHFLDGKAIDRYRDDRHDVVDADGVLLDYRWVVDRDGKLKLSVSSCAGCHTRLMPDGSLLRGAPGNFDAGEAPATAALLAPFEAGRGETSAQRFYADHGVPWLADDPHRCLSQLNDEQFAARIEQPDGAPPGTMFARFNGSPLYPTRMADLRGIRHRRYLDATGTHRNRGPEDVARYGILVEFADNGVFGPHHMLPAALERPAVRPPDAAMYAMALYLWSLEPPPGPFPMDATAQRGADVFAEQGCKKCHPPPDYTNGLLVPVPGFEPPAEPGIPQADISERRVDTDPGLALHTRKGTGYYRVPTLRGLWYRGLYGHTGDVNSLEDWFDPHRLDVDYAPTGWRGPGVTQRAVPGHEFGLDLAPEDKQALIAFLRTL